MAEAGVLPEEIVLKKEAARLMAELATITNPEARKAMMARIADVQMRQAMAEEARRAFLRG
jgi:predicted Rossmann-fold nucleotide-binding protein